MAFLQVNTTAGAADNLQVAMNIINTNMAALDNGTGILGLAAAMNGTTSVEAAIHELNAIKANESITIYASANSGLSGTGNLQSNITLTLNINNLTAISEDIALTDSIAVFNLSGAATQKVDMQTFGRTIPMADAERSETGVLVYPLSSTQAYVFTGSQLTKQTTTFNAVAYEMRFFYTGSQIIYTEAWKAGALAYTQTYNYTGSTINSVTGWV